MKSEVYDATSDILVKDLVFIAINKENGLTIEVPFCCLYPYEGEVVDRNTVNHKIWKNEKGNLIMCDCGCGFRNGKLGCLCLETKEEFYV